MGDLPRRARDGPSSRIGRVLGPRACRRRHRELSGRRHAGSTPVRLVIGACAFERGAPWWRGEAAAIAACAGREAMT
ncbi:MAG: hypothetical protein MZW92_07285 [Comamonadaceae bacterium]|nr:hypothetical protein [Comamonadaceae bacterium]